MSLRRASSLSTALEDASTISIRRDEIHWLVPRSGEPPPQAEPRPSQKGEILEMPCLFCEGKVRRSATPLRMDRRGLRLSLETIPAWICQRCDKPYYEAGDVDLLEEALARLTSLVGRSRA